MTKKKLFLLEPGTIVFFLGKQDSQYRVDHSDDGKIIILENILTKEQTFSNADDPKSEALAEMLELQPGRSTFKRKLVSRFAILAILIGMVMLLCAKVMLFNLILMFLGVLKLFDYFEKYVPRLVDWMYKESDDS